MAASQHWVYGFIVLSALVGVDGYYHFRATECHFSDDLSYLEYVDIYSFNKAEILRFNSTVGKFVGNTEFGVYNAEEWNKGPQLAQAQAEKERYCRNNVQIDINNILTKNARPEVRLRLVKPSSGSQPAMLMCSAYSFYPKLIKLTWYRDGKDVTSDMTSTEELADGDWYYQVHSHLEFTPKSGEKISCMVEHRSLKDPMEIVWDPSMPEPEKNKIAIGAAGLVLGLIVTAAGFIYYKTKARGRILVPTS